VSSTASACLRRGCGAAGPERITGPSNAGVNATDGAASSARPHERGLPSNDGGAPKGQSWLGSGRVYRPSRKVSHPAMYSASLVCMRISSFLHSRRVFSMTASQSGFRSSSVGGCVPLGRLKRMARSSQVDFMCTRAGKDGCVVTSVLPVQYAYSMLSNTTCTNKSQGNWRKTATLPRSHL